MRDSNKEREFLIAFICLSAFAAFVVMLGMACEYIYKAN